jgi:Zn-dependent M28 family amino/carboxypeptidase
MNFRTNSSIKISWRDFHSLQNRLYAHVNVLSNEFGPRNLQHYSALMKTSDYIARQMTQHNINFSTQQYCYGKKSIKNLISEKLGEDKADEIIIVGAHYDTVLDSPGADDNATGIACLLELVRMLHNYDMNRTLRFVAFTLEEPPFFGSEQMGSNVYAKSCKERDENIVAMIALEMLGYYKEKRRSQKYPLPDMKGHYSDKGNFIAIVGNNHSRQLGIDFAEQTKEASLVKTRAIIPNSPIHGIDLSDHSSFWKYNYPAIMITDTAFYRNPHYHESSDTIDKLNFRYFTRLVFSLAYALKQLDKKDLL